MVSQMSEDDMKSLGSTLRMGEYLDNPQSLKYNCPTFHAAGDVAFPGAAASSLGITAGLVGGNGIVNNSPFASLGGGQLVSSSCNIRCFNRSRNSCCY